MSKRSRRRARKEKVAVFGDEVIGYNPVIGFLGSYHIADFASTPDGSKSICGLRLASLRPARLGVSHCHRNDCKRNADCKAWCWLFKTVKCGRCLSSIRRRADSAMLYSLSLTGS